MRKRGAPEGKTGTDCSVAANTPLKVAKVMCDMCVEVKTPALKTCLKCEISMCARHLQHHLTTPVLLQTHPLTEATVTGATALGASKCKAHGKLLEYYCLDDCICVCVSCAVEDKHRLHNMKTLPAAYKELVEKLEVELKELNKREPESRKLGNREEKQRKKLEASSSKLLEKVLSLRDMVLTAVQNSVSSRIEAIQTAREAVKNILTEEGISVFLEKFAGVQEALERAHAVDFRRGLEPGANRDKMILKIWDSGDRIGEHMSQLQGNFLALIDPDHQQIPLSEITFDPNTVRERVSVSVDLKTLFYHPSNTYTIQGSTVFCKQNTSDGRNLHWIVKLTEHCDWSIGLRSKDNHIVHGLKWEKETLSCLNTECHMTQKCDNCVKRKAGRSGTGQMYHLSVSPINIPSFSGNEPMKALRPRKIEVFWDSESQVLSFYCRDRHKQGIQLCEIQLDRNEVLFPFVTLDTVTTKCPNTSDGMEYHYYESNGKTHTEIFCELMEE